MNVPERAGAAPGLLHRDLYRENDSRGLQRPGAKGILALDTRKERNFGVSRGTVGTSHYRPGETAP